VAVITITVLAAAHYVHRHRPKLQQSSRPASSD